jgi:gamma-glutamylcyclotransferase (GGCT)/AIG2-like uncharacterized protein YtfP
VGGDAAPRRIFVYGTLRKDVLGGGGSPLTRGWTFEGYGKVPGELYDFGTYPGAVPSRASGACVRGEVHRLPDDVEETLRMLDRYERCSADDPEPHEYRRELVDVELDDGRRVLAWIYWYRLPPRGRRLGSGDYLERTVPDVARR